MTVFNIRPAQCELLFPVVSVLLQDQGNWDTAISVTNPAYADEMASGGLTFTFYGIGNVEATYDTTIDGVTGRGLEVDGTLSPGSTYQVMASQILTVTNWGEEFIGHVHLLADYTNCSGLGWVTDWMGINQAYSAVVIDADTGTDPDVDLANCLVIRSTKQTAPFYRGPFAFLDPYVELDPIEGLGWT